MTSRDELGTHRRVMKLLDYASGSIKGSEGTVLRYAGDAILAEIPSIVSAINVAVGIHNELAERNAEEVEDNRVQIRIGLNLGEMLQDRDEIYGDGVNLAARLESSAEPGWSINRSPSIIHITGQSSLVGTKRRIYYSYRHVEKEAPIWQA